MKASRQLHCVMDDLVRGIQQGIRSLKRAPSFSVMAVATLALAIGAY
jgi:hypothetical protein